MTHFPAKWYRFFWAFMALFVAGCAMQSVEPPEKIGAMPPPRTAPLPMATNILAPTPPPPPGLTDAPAPAKAAGRTVKVALLLPLSGDTGELGQSLQDAATLALFDKYATLSPRDIPARVVLIPKDTGGSPAQAAQAATSALDEGAQLIIGPLFSQEVTAVAPIAAARGVNVISLSNNRAVAGRGVFLFGFMPEQQVRRVADYTFEHGASRIAALIPSDPYGSAVAKELTLAAKRHGGSITPTEFYPASTGNFAAPVSHIAKAMATQGDVPQALFVAEGGDKLKAIASELSNTKLNPSLLRLLGTGKWDDSDLLRSPNLVGGWFASAPVVKYKGYEQRFMSNYGYKPQRLASLAYDAVALAATLALNPSGPDFSAATLTGPGGFIGPANGIFRFGENGICERGLAVLEVTPTGFRTIDPAPEVFR